MLPQPPPSEPDTRIIDRGEAVGRFVLIGLLGRGGMGEVYAAYDPELDRKVAVKILRGGRSHDGEARLLREAQAIAKLQHPNVVVVYDVGAFRDSVFIAMEFVDGHTLGYWMNAERRPWRETLRIFQAAGRGLEAAHGLGMVHRDFKPDNVMLTKDGQVRVMDFGLARQVGEDTEAGAGSGARAARPAADVDPDSTMPATPSATKGVSQHSSGGYLNLKLTETGATIGTPAYMAPEQLAAKPTNARSDQFSFCVALYEALYGERPFAGETMMSLMTNVIEGNVRPSPDGARVPGWIRRVLLRGLSTEPDARFPSMKELLAALDDDPAVKRRRWLSLAGVGVLVGALALVAARAGTSGRAMCGDGAARFAGVWEAGGARSERKEAIRAAFARTGKPFAAQAFVAASRLLDDYVGRWTAMYRDACEATNIRGDQSAQVLDLRMACLGGRVENVRALADVFSNADGDVVVNAVSAAGALPLLDGCADVSALRAVDQPLDDPAIRKRVAELREELARVTAIRDAGNCDKALKRGVALIENIRATKYRPLLAEALNVVGYLGNFCADPNVSLALIKESYAEAVAGHVDELAAYSASIATVYLANRLGQLASARDWLLVARAALERVGPRDYLRGNFLCAEGDVLGAEHDYDHWVEKTREATALTVRAYGPDHYLSLAGLSNIGDALAVSGRYSEAVAADATAIAASERVLGPEHPIVATELNNQCEALNGVGHYEEALRACGRALEIWGGAGADVVVRSYAQTSLGRALLGLGRAGEAIAPLEQAVSARTAAHVGATLEGESRFVLARALWSRPADRRRALALARQARNDDGTDAKAVAEVDAWLAKAR